MNVNVIDKDTSQIVGLEIETSLVDGRFMTDVNDLIEDALSTLVLDKVLHRKHVEVVLGVSSNLKEDGSYTFLLGAEVESVTETPESTVHREIPAAKYAVVTAKGEMPFALIEAHQYLRDNWLPQSIYDRASSPSFEVYGEKAWEIENPEIDVFIPIRER